ncbi:DUF4145 domain-containing protein [Rhizobium laguerreae]|uniref:DUF4145 domain-containing protein n=1 Tax=Rhizobium laguerreae TaxID=1076926 RepID=UPI0036F42D1C
MRRGPSEEPGMHTERDNSNASMMGAQLNRVPRCPHCGVASPHLFRVWASSGGTVRNDGGQTSNWAAYCCTACGAISTVSGRWNGKQFDVTGIFPAPKTAHEDLPDRVRTYLQQAYQTLSAPDAAAMVAGSAVDAMLKEVGYPDGSLYSRIDKAVADAVLTKGMGGWAHAVRLGSNRPRHADADEPHVAPAQAAQSVEFAEALGNFLFVLTKKIERGIEAATPSA